MLWCFVLFSFYNDFFGKYFYFLLYLGKGSLEELDDFLEEGELEF